MNTQKHRSPIEATGRKVLQAGLALAATFGTIQETEAKTHHGVMAIAGSTGGYRADILDLEYDPANPGASKVTAQNKVNKSAEQVDAATMGYDHFTSGNNLVMHEPQGWGTSTPGLHVYWNTTKTLTKGATKSNLILDASNVEDYDDKNEFLLSEGDTPDQDQVIAVNGKTNDLATEGIIKTYSILKDENGKITGLKLLAKTDLTAEGVAIYGEKRVYKDYMVSMDGYDQVAAVLKKDTQGKWNIIAKKIFAEGFSTWSKIDRKPVFPTPNGEINTWLPSTDGYKIPLLDKNLNKVDEVDTGGGVTRFGKDGKYQINYSEADGAYCVKNSKGEKVTLGKDVKFIDDAGLVQIDTNPETFFGVSDTSANFIILKVTENPLKVETYVSSQAAFNGGYKSSSFLTTQDFDGDAAYLTDNCPTTPNPDQLDTDKDGLGDACDPTPGTTTTGDVGTDADAGSKPDTNGTDASTNDADAASNQETIDQDTVSPDATEKPDTQQSDTAATFDITKDQDAGATETGSEADPDNAVTGSDTTQKSDTASTTPPSKPPEGCAASPTTPGSKSVAGIIALMGLAIAAVRRKKED